MKILAMLAAGAMLGVFADSASAAEAPMLKKGDAAPNFTLKGSDEKPTSCPSSRARRRWLWPGSPKPSPVAEPSSASRSVRAAKN